jgi:hypothetical protein
MDYVTQSVYALGRRLEGTTLPEHILYRLSASASTEFGTSFSRIELLFDDNGVQLGISLNLTDRPRKEDDFGFQVFGSDWQGRQDDADMTMCWRSLESCFSTHSSKRALLVSLLDSRLENGSRTRTPLCDEELQTGGIDVAVVASLGADEPQIRMAAYKLPEDVGSREQLRDRMKDMSLTRELSRDTLGFSLRPVEEGRAWLNTMNGTMPC